MEAIFSYEALVSSERVQSHNFENVRVKEFEVFFITVEYEVKISFQNSYSPYHCICEYCKGESNVLRL
jgi:hypothetical protein